MKSVEQIEFRSGLGDCFRACVASIFEFDIEDMPNFWEETQDGNVFWVKVNMWLIKHYSCKCLSVAVAAGYEHYVKDVLCVANGKSPMGDEDHAVVWLNGIIHDPHPLRVGIKGLPDTFTFFMPLRIDFLRNS